MIYEILDSLRVDVDKLRRHFVDHVASLPPVMQGPMFGGWSIQSVNGDYTDGWKMGHLCFTKNPVTGKVEFDKAKADAMGLAPQKAYSVPTQINFGYVREIMDRIDDLGLEPRRARFSLLKGPGQSAYHRDCPDNVYAVRLHIPVITNETCTFDSEGESAHMPADGTVYLLRVNRMHQIFNHRSEDRIHIIMDVWDHKGISKHHRFV